jgi:AbiTii
LPAKFQMVSIILELQEEAANPAISVTSLLRKTLLVASKLKLLDIVAWANLELNGYPGEDDEVPKYRLVRGIVQYCHPYQGWQVLHFRDTQIEALCKQMLFLMPVAEIEGVLCDEQYIRMSYPPKKQAAIIQLMGGYPFTPALVISKSSIIRILDAIRSRIMEIMLAVEEKGIMGEGLKFTISDQGKVAGMVIQGDYIDSGGGDIMSKNSQSPIQNKVTDSSQTISGNSAEALGIIRLFIGDLRVALTRIEMSETARSEAEAEIQTLEAQVKSPKPKWAIIGVCLQTLKTLLEGVAGNIIAAGLLQRFPEILSLIS